MRWASTSQNVLVSFGATKTLTWPFSIVTGIYSDNLKIAQIITPIYKADSSTVKNYWASVNMNSNGTRQSK